MQKKEQSEKIQSGQDKTQYFKDGTSSELYKANPLKVCSGQRMTRRSFMASALAAGFVATGRASERTSLIPEGPGATPNYWCTWGCQNYAVDRATVHNSLSHTAIASNLTETAVFGPNGWSRAFGRVQRDLYMLFDLGWDVARGVEFDDAHWKLGSQEVAVDKFPSCTGTATERLRKLNQMSRKAGWKGAGVWIPAQVLGDGRNGKMLSDEEVREYLRLRLRWSADAGIEYWKVDYGSRNNLAYRELMTNMGKEIAPNLRIEHARGTPPLNDVRAPYENLAAHNSGAFANWGDGSVLRDSVAVASISAVFRSYDVTPQLSTATTLDRVSQILVGTSKLRGANGLINCEDEPYIAASLGLMIGIMRHPQFLSEETAGLPYDPFKARKRIDEVTRAVRWHRIAPAFAMGTAQVALDDLRLNDNWQFAAGDCWADWVNGTTVVQGAPARIARGLALPIVKGDELPFVAACRNPNRAVAIATFPRVSGRGRSMPLADVSLQVERDTRIVGIFGRYRSLQLVGVRNVKRVLAQDLAGDSAEDITHGILRTSEGLLFPGQLLQQVGLRAATPGDQSAPGLAVELSI